MILNGYQDGALKVQVQDYLNGNKETEIMYS